MIIGQRLLAETEGVGAAVLEDLSHQRETMQHARAKVIGSILNVGVNYKGSLS